MKKILFLIISSTFFQLAMAQGTFLYPQTLFSFQAENGKIGFTDANGKLIILPKYDDAQEQTENMTAIKINGKWGYIDEKGKEVIAPQYDDASQFHEEKAAVKKGDKYGFINTEGRDVISFVYESAYDFSEGLARVRYKGKYGYIDRNGKKVIPFEFDEAGDFSEGVAKVWKGTTIYDKQGFIDKTGKLILPYEYDHDMVTFSSSWRGPRRFQDGLMYVSKKGQKGYIDKRGKEIIALKFGQLTPLYNGWAAYYDDTERKWGILYRNGKEYTPAIFDQINLDLLELGYSLIITANEDKNAKNYSGKRYGLFSTAGEHMITLPYYDHIGEISDGMMPVELNKKHGAIDSTGRLAVPAKYDFVDKFSNGTALVELNKKYGVVNKNGKEILAVKYDGIENFSDGLAVVGLNGKMGYADMNGREVIPLQYDDAYSFAEGIGVVKGAKYGFIDKTGKAITPQKYDKVTYFLNGLSVVTIGDKNGVIDKTGKEVVPVIHSQITNISGYLYFARDGKWGVMNSTGNVIIPARYEGFVQQFIGETAVAVKNGRAIYVDKTGKEVGELLQ